MATSCNLYIYLQTFIHSLRAPQSTLLETSVEGSKSPKTGVAVDFFVSMAGFTLVAGLIEARGRSEAATGTLAVSEARMLGRGENPPNSHPDIGDMALIASPNLGFPVRNPCANLFTHFAQ